MRKTPWLLAEPFRKQFPGYKSLYGDSWGVFIIQNKLRVIASDGDYKSAKLPQEFAWEHVSVSLQNRCPTWEEMCLIKDIFWEEEETVIQFHPKKSEYINRHPYTLHLWRPILLHIPLPPREAI